PFVTRGEVHVGLGPPLSPVVARVVERGGTLPVLPGEGVRVTDPHPPLLRGVDEKESAERPVSLASGAAARFLVDEENLPAGIRQLSGGDEAGESGADDDDVGRGRCWCWHPDLLRPESSIAGGLPPS